MNIFGTTGQDRRAWLNDQGDNALAALQYYLGPGVNVNALATIADAFNPVADIGRAGTAARGVVRPGATISERVGSFGDMATDIASVAAPVAGAGYADDAARVLEDALMGASFGAREFGRHAGMVANQPGTLDQVNAFVGPPLIVQHNTTANKLAFTDELGGMPYPSLAIARADAPLENFGDISLLGGPEMAVPDRMNRVFPGDGYTVRQPRGELQPVNDRALSQAMKADPRFSHLRDATYWMGSFDDVGRADDAMRTVQAAIAEGLDPTQFDNFHDMWNAAQRQIGYRTPDAPGLREFGELERVLPQGYTYSGNRKRPKPYTLDNVMAEMRKEARNAGAEGFNYGPASFRAHASQPFSRFSQVSGSRDLIQPPEATEEAFSAFSDTYTRLINDIGETTGQGGWRGSDSASSYINDYASGRTREWRGVDWVDNMDPELRGRIDALRNQSRELPVNYFEAKPQRAVGLGEFEAAIIPEGSDQAAEILQRSGVRQILTYGSPDERRQLFQRFPELLFSTAGGGLALDSLMQSEDERSEDINAILAKYGL